MLLLKDDSLSLDDASPSSAGVNAGRELQARASAHASTVAAIIAGCGRSRVPRHTTRKFGFKQNGKAAASECASLLAKASYCPA